MARRKKEEPIVHKNRIASQANQLFLKFGVEGTTMDDIAKAAGYSKATLYVYFSNKDDIVAFLALKSMTGLRDVISKAVSCDKSFKQVFFEICYALNDFYESFPDFFDLSLKYINIDFPENANEGYLKVYEVGEEINALLINVIEQGIKDNAIKPCSNYYVLIFQIWGMLSGLIKLASEKESYLNSVSGFSKQEFLQMSFEKIYKIL